MGVLRAGGGNERQFLRLSCPTLPWCSKNPSVWPPLTMPGGQVTDAHERSVVGNLVRPEELYLTPNSGASACSTLRASRSSNSEWRAGEGEQLNFSPRPRRAFTERCRHDRRGRPAAGEGSVVLLAVSSGEVERLADIFNEYNVSFRIGSRTPKPGSEVYVDESSISRTCRPLPSSRLTCPPESCCPRRASCSSAPTICLTTPRSAQAPAPRQRSKISAFLSDFRDLAMGDYVVHVEHGIGRTRVCARFRRPTARRPSSWCWNTPKARGSMFR